jgi:phosphoribosylformimino-5-aminoimidazole carboxamide ribotide isomerase
VANDPLETALGFQNSGAKYLHMVDLDGAKDAKLVNRDIFTDIAKKTNLKIEIGGGIRSLDAIEYYLSHGLYRAILGSVAVKNPEFVKTAVKEYGNRIVVGIDAKNGMVASEGWLDVGKVDYIELAKRMCDVGVRYIVFTDISKDGTLEGPNLEQLSAINQATNCNIIASGGISGIKDIKALTKLGVYGTICGKSLYKGTLDLKQAIELSGQQD